MLCLASGGGQQGPILSAAGAAVTVFDNSPQQLAQDWMVAERDGFPADFDKVRELLIKQKPLVKQYSSSSYLNSLVAGEIDLPDPLLIADGLSKRYGRIEACREVSFELYPGEVLAIAGESGSGMVKITTTCKHEARRVTIDASLMGDDKDMLEDLIAAAMNDAVRRAEALTQEKMGGMTAGMQLPPGMKLPF